MLGKKTVTEETTGKEPGDQLEDLDPFAIPARVQKEYYHFFSEQNNTHPGYEIKLYKVPKSRQQALEYLESFSGVVPHEDELGYKYGSCTLRAHGHRPGQREPDVRTIILSDIWNQKKEEWDRAHAPVISGDSGGVNQGLAIAERLISMMSKLNNGNGNSNGNGGNGPDKMFKGIASQIEGMQVQLLKGAVEERFNLYKEFKTLMKEQNENQPAVDDSQDAFLNTPVVKEVVQTILDYGLDFLKAKGPKRQQAKEMIQGHPGFAEIMKDEKRIIEVYNKLKADPKIGKDKADQMFAEFDIAVQDVPVPEEETAGGS